MNGSASFNSTNGAAPPPSGSPLRLEDLCPRPALSTEREALRDYLADRTVLVTGAAGSIGTELSHQLLSLQPGALILVDVSEHNLFRLEERLPACNPVPTLCLADVRDTDTMASIFAAHEPDLVLHAAAYKHVPLMERHPRAAFQNNTLATARLVDLSQTTGVEQFVLVSTDKAVEPVSVLGATKQLAEWYVRAAASTTACKIVRFGNVFGSRGSVVPQFERQLAAGGPLTVTHPEMERYFMSAREACHLILQTLLLDTAPIYALEMGKPIQIRGLAEQMVRHRYPDRDPDDLIVYTGRRAGEKLSEQLQAPEETRIAIGHANIVGLEGPLPLAQAELETMFRRLNTSRHSMGDVQLREALLGACRSARPA